MTEWHFPVKLPDNTRQHTTRTFPACQSYVQHHSPPPQTSKCTLCCLLNVTQQSVSDHLTNMPWRNLPLWKKGRKLYLLLRLLHILVWNWVVMNKFKVWLRPRHPDFRRDVLAKDLYPSYWRYSFGSDIWLWKWKAGILKQLVKNLKSKSLTTYWWLLLHMYVMVQILIWQTFMHALGTASNTAGLSWNSIRIHSFSLRSTQKAA